MVRFLLALVLLASLFAAVNVYGQDAARARELWERAIIAKGGREQLYKVKTLHIWYTETTRNVFGVVVHRGLVNSIYDFPNRVWSWDDGLPSPFHLSVGWLDIEQNKRCILYQGAADPVCGPVIHTTFPAEGITQVQYLYLMESRWVKPEPIGVSAGRVGGKKVEILQTRIQDKVINYSLDRNTNLPVRIEVFYKGSTRATLTVDLSDYAPVDGIQMPTKRKSAKLNFEINPSYNVSLFKALPSIAAGPDVWKPTR